MSERRSHRLRYGLNTFQRRWRRESTGVPPDTFAVTFVCPCSCCSSSQGGRRKRCFSGEIYILRLVISSRLRQLLQGRIESRRRWGRSKSYRWRYSRGVNPVGNMLALPRMPCRPRLVFRKYAFFFPDPEVAHGIQSLLSGLTGCLSSRFVDDDHWQRV